MIKTLTPYSNTARTAEIMSRYRPIAPKPENPDNHPMEDSSALSQKIKQSPYLRNLWSQLQARPTRTRKRGRGAFSLPSIKRHKTHVLGFCPPCHVTSPLKNLSLQGFASDLVPQLPLSNFGMLDNSNLESKKTPKDPSLITLPLLPCSPAAAALEINLMKPGREEVIDLNTVPEEKDLLKQLQGQNVNVITPQPMRPVGSSISVGCINEDPTLPPPANGPKRREEVEKEVEAEAWPAVISDSNNKVRMTNSAYREMVGQPECSWLDSMVTSYGRLPCKRISGEVTLNVGDSMIPISSNGFQCWVRIEWKTNHKKSSMDTSCDVIRISCESSDYLFAWRFHTYPREASQPSYHV